MGTTSIEWAKNVDGSAGKTWNPTRGCELTSPGCHNCYAMKIAHRFSGAGEPFDGLTRLRDKGGPVWVGKGRLVESMLDLPLRTKKPTTWFVNSMSDLFWEEFTNKQIAAVFGVMAACPHHRFQVLTKRAERMREWFRWVSDEARPHPATACGIEAVNHGADVDYLGLPDVWPLPNVWLGVSAEDQQRADERISHLLETPAVVRFVSAEPLLGPIDFNEHEHLCETWRRGVTVGTYLDWVILGSESGPGARPMDVAWAESIVHQCKDTRTACFVKQIANASDKKGGDPRHWPPGDWPRQMPEVRR